MEKPGEDLKHLGFVRTVALNAVVCVSYLYDYAKQNSGSLKSTVETVENTVTAVVGPVYERFKGFPDDVLVFLDKKVDDASSQFDEHAPPLAKKIVSGVQLVVRNASEAVIYLAQEAMVSGPRSAVGHAASLVKGVAVTQLVVLWYEVNRFPPVRVVGDMTIPTVAYWSKKYNKFISKMAARGYPIFGYFPSVPLDDVVKAYKQVESAAVKKDDGVSSEVN